MLTRPADGTCQYPAWRCLFQRTGGGRKGGGDGPLTAFCLQPQYLTDGGQKAIYLTGSHSDTCTVLISCGFRPRYILCMKRINQLYLMRTCMQLIKAS